MTTNVTITIRSQIREIPADPADTNEIIEYSTPGILKIEGAQFELSYDESGDMGMENSKTTLACDMNRPSVVTMTRSGALSCTMIFDSVERRRKCMYNTAYFPIDLCICTNEVSFEMSEAGGSIKLDYFIELGGVNSEHTVLCMTVIPAALDKETTR